MHCFDVLENISLRNKNFVEFIVLAHNPYNVLLQDCEK